MRGPPIHTFLTAPPQRDIADTFVITIRSSASLAPWPAEALVIHGGIPGERIEAIPGLKWTVPVTPIRPGAIAIRLPGTGLAGLDGQPVQDSNLLTRFHAAATARIDGPQPTMDGAAEITIRWSRPVIGFDTDKIIPDDLALADFTQIDPTTWHLTATPTNSPIEAALTIPAGVVTDDLGLPNAASRWQSYAIAPAIDRVRPILEQVWAEADGSFTAVWGYLNDHPRRSVRIPVGPDNRFVPGPLDRGQPTEFLPGRQVAAFEVPFASGNLVWSIRSPDGSATTATAGSGAAIPRP